MRITSCAVGLVVIETEEDGTVRIGAMPYTKGGRTSIRHVMETAEEGETIEHTLHLAALHELAADAAEFEYELISYKPIIVEFGPCQLHAGGTHMKVFFAVRVVKGKLRDFDRPDGDEMLGPIQMMEAKKLLDMTDGRTPPVHVRATKAGVCEVAKDRKVFDRYSQIIHSFKPVPLTAEQEEAIEAFPGKW